MKIPGYVVFNTDFNASEETLVKTLQNLQQREQRRSATTPMSTSLKDLFTKKGKIATMIENTDAMDKFAIFK